MATSLDRINAILRPETIESESDEKRINALSFDELLLLLRRITESPRKPQLLPLVKSAYSRLLPKEYNLNFSTNFTFIKPITSGYVLCYLVEDKSTKKQRTCIIYPRDDHPCSFHFHAWHTSIILHSYPSSMTMLDCGHYKQVELDVTRAYSYILLENRVVCSLSQLWEKTKPSDIPLAHRLMFVINLLSQMDYLHQRRHYCGIVTFDSILIDKNGRAIFSSSNSNVRDTIVGALKYLAPEIRLQESISKYSDIYNITVLALEIIAWGPNLRSLTNLLSECPKELQPVLEPCLAPEPKGRTTTIPALLQAFREHLGQLPEASSCKLYNTLFSFFNTMPTDLLKIIIDYEHEHEHEELCFDRILPEF